MLRVYCCDCTLTFGKGFGLAERRSLLFPGALLHRRGLLPRPERVTSSREAMNSKSLMQEGGGIEPHRADTRLTAYKAASAPNGLRLPHQNADVIRRHRQNLCGPGQTRTGISELSRQALCPFELRGHLGHSTSMVGCTRVEVNRCLLWSNWTACGKVELYQCLSADMKRKHEDARPLPRSLRSLWG